MRRRLGCFAVFIVLALVTSIFKPVLIYAETGNEHDQDMERLLFGDDGVRYANNHKALNNNSGDVEGQRIYALERSAYLCVDQYGRIDQKGTNCIGYLRKYVGNGIPKQLSEINPAGTGMQHRSYTHQGWDHDYSKDSFYAQTRDSLQHNDKWNARKTILLNTADKVFAFRFMSTGWLFGHDEKCNSLCALIYYTHILGDYIEDGDYSKFFDGSNGKKIPFAQLGADEANPDLFYELNKHLDVLFADQKAGKNTYRSLKDELNTLANKARRLEGIKSTLSKEEAYEQAHEYAKELMTLLTGYSKNNEYDYANRIHMLLMNEGWFRKAFPSL